MQLCCASHFLFHLSGLPTQVKVNILIRSMGPISEMKMVKIFNRKCCMIISCCQYYSMDCYFRQYWRDTRLSFKGLKMTSNHIDINQLSLNVKMLEKIWKPDTFFHNGLDSYLHTITRPNKLFRISENGDITYSMRSENTYFTTIHLLLVKYHSKEFIYSIR